MRSFLFCLTICACSIGCSDSTSPVDGSAGAGGAGGSDGGSPPNTFIDPGTDAWEPVAEADLADVCGLDAALLKAADAEIARSYAIVRYGRLCWEHYPSDQPQITDAAENWSATKTFAAMVLGMAAYQTREFERTGRQTGPISDADRMDHWVDDITFNPDAQVAHVLAMIAHNDDLSFGARMHQYDAIGSIQINRLSDVVNTAIQQDTTRLGNDIEEFTQRFVYEPLGMTRSVWSEGDPDKVFAASWVSPVREMARVGLLLMNDGMWNGERLLESEWIYRMTHPAFEDSNTGYGYLTWLNARSNWSVGGIIDDVDAPRDPCAPMAIYREHPHGLSEATDCGYEPGDSCEQDLDVGAWFAEGLGGQYIVGHRGLDLVIVGKDIMETRGPGFLWEQVRPALLVHDETYAGDEDGFCAAYSSNRYAPDLRR